MDLEKSASGKKGRRESVLSLTAAPVMSSAVTFGGTLLERMNMINHQALVVVTVAEVDDDSLAAGSCDDRMSSTVL